MTYTTFDNDRPELGSIKIRMPYANVGQFSASTGATGFEIEHFLSYELHEDWTTPCAAFSFTLDADELSTDERNAILPGVRVDVSIDDRVQMIGFVDKIHVASSPHGGTVLALEGRDWLSPAVDAQVDPQVRFKAGMSLIDVLSAVFGDFGMTAVAADNAANRDAISGAIYGLRQSSRGTVSKKILTHQLKPYANEGAYQFASRVSQRFGLWIRPSATFGTIVVTSPDFDQASRYTLHHKTDASAPFNNVEESTVEWNREQQPSIIFAAGGAGGGEFATSQLRACVVNPLVATPPNNLAALIAKYPGIRQVPVPTPTQLSGTATVPIPDPNARPAYLYDCESHTQAQLEAFLLRELSLRMRKSLTARYTIEGHKIGGVAVTIDTMIDVDDDRAPLRTALYVFGRRFSKTLSGGTKTDLDLIRPGSLVFSDSDTDSSS